MRFAAVHTSLKAIRRQRERLGDWEVKLALPTPKRADVAPGFQEEDFKLGAECFLNLPGSSWRTTPEQKWEDEKEEGICLFLYEVSSGGHYSILNMCPG